MKKRQRLRTTAVAAALRMPRTPVTQRGLAPTPPLEAAKCDGSAQVGQHDGGALDIVLGCHIHAGQPVLGMLLTIQLCVYPHAYAEHLTWGAILLFLLTRGPGAFALDQLLGWEPARECPE